jgi:hypothetical protein
MQTTPKEQFAVLYSPKRKKKRYAENCVTLADSQAEALKQMDEDKNLLAAKVYGPSLSSESTRIYYVISWL